MTEVVVVLSLFPVLTFRTLLKTHMEQQVTINDEREKGEGI